MNPKTLLTALLLTALGTTAQGVEISQPELDLTPDMVMPGTPFAASLEGIYSQSCLLGPGVVTGSYSNDGFEIKFRSDNRSTDCVADSVKGTEHFGAFRLPENAVNFLDPNLPMKVTFIVDGKPIAESYLDLTFDPAELPHQVLSSGVYWDAAFYGSAMSVEDLHDHLFVAANMFDGAGNAIWRTAYGPVVGGTLDASFLAFEDGACIACGDIGIEPTIISDDWPVQLMIQGTGEAFMSFGNSPDRAVHLVRFDTQGLPAEERAPILMGSWVFVDRDTGMVLEDVRFDLPIRTQDLTLTISEDDNVSVTCLDYDDCRLTVGALIEDLDRSEIAPDRILGDRLVGIRIR